MPTKKKSGAPPFTVLVDTSEKKPWVFEKTAYCAGSKPFNLYTADYSLDGLYQDKTLAIEKKASVSELAGNLTNAEKWDDFRQELERLDEFRWPFLVLEFTPKDLLAFPKGTAIPASVQRRIRLKGPYLMKLVCEIELKYRTRIVWAGTLGKEYTLGLFKRAWESVNG